MKLHFLDLLALTVLWTIPSTAFPYDVAVHRKISEQAFKDARTAHDFLADLGVGPAIKINGNAPAEWVISGSATEDDGFRSVNHFFDPINNRGLNGVFLGIPYNFATARDWAGDGSGNDYSIPKARQYFYTALTAPGVAERDQAWANTFQAVGQFTHLLQDMAQPQHVRNDAHLSFSENLNWLTPGYSRYEQYTNRLVSALRYDGSYPVVSQPTYREYWQAGGKGLAEFTNANFVSQNTNLDFNPYPGPVVTNTYTYEEIKPQETSMDGVTYNNVTVRYVGNTFTDAYTGGTVTNNSLSAFSVFDFVYRNYSAGGIYTMTDTNYQSYADILIPRAVGYSAGLINYFFRGQVALVESPDHPGFYTIKNLSSEDMNGTFKLYYDDASDVRHEVPGAVWSLQIQANGESELITLPLPVSASLPQPKGTDKLVLAFTGSMGPETSGGIAGKIVACADSGAVGTGGQANITPIAPLDLIAKHKAGQTFAPIVIDGVVRLAFSDADEQTQRALEKGKGSEFDQWYNYNQKTASSLYRIYPDHNTGDNLLRSDYTHWENTLSSLAEGYRNAQKWFREHNFKIIGIRETPHPWWPTWVTVVTWYVEETQVPDEIGYDVLAGCAGGLLNFKSEVDAALWLSENLAK